MRIAVYAQATVSIAASTVAVAAEENPFEAKILDVRPRVFFRRDNFDGLTIERRCKAAGQKEFAGVREKWRPTSMGRGILWLLDGKREDLLAAIAGLKRMDARDGNWSDRGPDLIQLAALFDWLYPELDEATRKTTIANIERAADDAVAHICEGRAPYFYSRTPGGLAGMTVAGIARVGASDKAEGYLKLFREWGVPDDFKPYQWVDGAATGATYTVFYSYDGMTDALPALGMCCSVYRRPLHPLVRRHLRLAARTFPPGQHPTPQLRHANLPDFFGYPVARRPASAHDKRLWNPSYPPISDSARSRLDPHPTRGARRRGRECVGPGIFWSPMATRRPIYRGKQA